MTCYAKGRMNTYLEIGRLFCYHKSLKGPKLFAPCFLKRCLLCSYTNVGFLGSLKRNLVIVVSVLGLFVFFAEKRLSESVRKKKKC